MQRKDSAMSDGISESAKNSSRTFISGVAILGIATVIVKIIGLIYKIPLMSVLGSDGMGFFNSAYEIYSLFYVIASAGLPVALSILVAENRARNNEENVKRIFRIAMMLFVVIGTVGTAVMLGSAGFFSDYYFKENKNAVFCYMAIAPTVLFISISGAIRGFFQGCQKMTPTALSEVVEALSKLFLGLTLAIWATSAGYDKPTSAAFAILGITVGSALSMLYLIITKILHRSIAPTAPGLPQSGERLGTKSILGNLIRIAVPVTISSSVVSLTRIIDMTMILRRLQATGYSVEISNAMYGSYSTLALPIYSLPATLVVAIALPLVSMLTDAAESRDREREKNVITSSVRICALVAIPCALGITVFAKPILELLFSNQSEAIDFTAPLLSILGASVLFSCLITVSNSILQAYKKVGKPIIAMSIGAAVKLVSSYILLGIPSVNIYGAPISTLLCCITIVGVNFYYVYKYSEAEAAVVKTFYKPLIASVISIGAAFGLYMLLGANGVGVKINASVSIIAAAMLYAVCALKIGAVDESEITLLPGGEKTAGILKKMKLLKK